MSTGTSIPYHLRPNKAVERGLFIQALRRINKYVNISDYRYIGFGGPFMEDFKILHQELRISNMICIEKDENTRIRQKFNKPLSCIDFYERACSSTDFVNAHDFDRQSIVWLDFISFNDLNKQLSDVVRLIGKLSHGDIFKVTLNAHSPNLGKPEGDDDVMEYRLNRFKELITEEYESHELNAELMHAKQFPYAVLASLKRAISKGMASAVDLQVVPINAFVYEDGQKMLTAMGIVLEKNQIAEFNEKTSISSWVYYSERWEQIKNISLPALSSRERLLVEQMLPGSNYDEIRETLGFYPAEKEALAKEQMENFISYYRTFPWFGKFTL